ncbi:MAG: MATE family efflux transporter [Eubacteriales bacterium]|nr:MATE family efflux transporter [Eubacteriales bacterium]
MNHDLTTGKPETVLWKFCLPLFGSIVFQQLYNIADSWVAGKFIGQNALAAVGNSYEITLIFLAFAFGCNIGCSVLVSQLFGAKEYGGMKTAVSTAMLCSGEVCLLLMLVGILGCDSLLGLINTPQEVFADSALYLDIYIWGLPFVFFYNLSTGIFSALGDSKTPFAFLAVSSLTNIAVDILFVTAFHMGVAGVAWATFLCQGISCILAITVVLRRLKTIPSAGKPALFSAALLRRFAVIAIPSVLQQSFISVGNILIQSVINRFGTDVMAGYSASVKLNNLVITSFTTIGNGISNYAAQNLGAGKLARVREGFRAGLKMVWLICLPLVALYCTCGRALMHFFMEDATEAALSSGMTFLRILSPFYFVVSAKLVADGILRGTGKMRQFMAATFTDLILRVVLAFILSCTALGSTGIWCAWPVGWTVATCLSIRFYCKGDWNDKAAVIQ